MMNELTTIMRADDARLLGAAGVASVAELARRNPTHLTARIGHDHVPSSKHRVGPSASQIAEWIRRARLRVDPS